MNDWVTTLGDAIFKLWTWGSSFNGNSFYKKEVACFKLRSEIHCIVKIDLFYDKFLKNTLKGRDTNHVRENLNYSKRQLVG